MENLRPKLNIIYFFFEDDYFKWPIRSRLDSFTVNNRNIKIIGINHPVSIFTLFANPFRFFKFLFKKSGKIKENISFFTPFGLLPVNLANKSALFVKIHRFIFKLQIGSHLNSIGAAGNRIMWVYSLTAFPCFYGSVERSKLLVYDCEDEYTMKENTVIKAMKDIENEILKKSDIVFTISKNIYESRKGRNENCYYIPNGVDFSFFNKADSPETELSEEIRHIPGPIVGYLGNIRSWLDFEVLEFLADKLPNVSFVFVGPVERDVKGNVDSLRMWPNVYFLERKERELLPSILKGFDVCTIPFKCNQFNLSTNPLKFWEYLATGRPILSLRLPDLEPYGDILYLYINKEEALRALLVALNERDPLLKERRMELAKNNDLALRSKLYYDILVSNCYE